MTDIRSFRPRHSDSLPPHITPLNPVAFLLRNALIYPDKPALTHPETKRAWTYIQWSRRVCNLSYALLSRGIKSGTKVAVIAPNVPVIADALQACPAIGAVIVPLNTRLTKPEVEYILKHSESSFVLADVQCKQLLEGCGLPTIVAGDGLGSEDGYEDFLAEGEKYGQGHGWQGIELQTDEDAPLALCYTSGTTGRPKGVILTHRGCYLAAISNMVESGMNRDSVLLWLLPLFHVRVRADDLASKQETMGNKQNRRGKKANKGRKPFIPSGPPSGIASFPTELLIIVFGEVVKLSEGDTNPMQPLWDLQAVCRAWKAAVAIVPLPHVVVKNLTQSARMVEALDDRSVASTSTKALTLMSPQEIDRKEKGTETYANRITSRWAAILDRSPNANTLRLHFRIGYKAPVPPLGSVFAEAFLGCSALTNLNEFTIGMASYTGPLALLFPVLAACRQLSSLELLGSWKSSDGDRLSPMPTYQLQSFNVPGLSCECGQTQCRSLIALLGNTTAPKLLHCPVDHPWRLYNLARSDPRLQFAGTLETVDIYYGDHFSSFAAFPQLRCCIARSLLSAQHLAAAASSSATQLRLSNTHAHSPTFIPDVFLPLLNGGGLPGISTIAFEYRYPRDYRCLDRLEVIEDACIANGIEFDLVEEL